MSEDLPLAVIEKFWKHVDKTPTGCWNWQGQLDHGTPTISYGGKTRVRMSARKLSLLVNGELIDSSKSIIVQALVCKNVLCVNPDHLSIVSGALPLWYKRKDTCEKCGDPLTIRGKNNVCWPCRNMRERERRKDPQYNDRRKLYVRKYIQSNKEKIRVSRAVMYQRRKSDPTYMMRKIVSSSIRNTMKRGGSRKDGGVWKHLPYTSIQLQEHLESLFEPWMTWDNHGQYIPKNWDDNDPSTWTWQLDHIIPQSKLAYTSMQEANFQKAWALENLRPLSAKQNITDNNRR